MKDANFDEIFETEGEILKFKFGAFKMPDKFLREYFAHFYTATTDFGGNFELRHNLLGKDDFRRHSYRNMKKIFIYS